ncbi:MAG: hypothetical protein MJ252_19820, partial [archaeon]|nr:hypothetical protein [archaeon]
MSSVSLKEKILFWGSISGLATIAITSMYYLYQYIQEEDEEESKAELSPELNQNKLNIDIKEDEIFSKGELTTEGVVKLVVKMNKISDDFFKKEYPDLDEKRRKEINNEKEYFNLCNQTIMYKQMCSKAALESIVNNFKNKNINADTIEEFISKADPKQIEVESIKYAEEDEILKSTTKEIIKEAYIFYAKNFIEESKKFQEKYNSMQMMFLNEDQQAMLMMELMTVKIKIDDLLYLKYNLSEDKLKVALYKRDLISDLEIQKYRNDM